MPTGKDLCPRQAGQTGRIEKHRRGILGTGRHAGKGPALTSDALLDQGKTGGLGTTSPSNEAKDEARDESKKEAKGEARYREKCCHAFFYLF